MITIAIKYQPANYTMDSFGEFVCEHEYFNRLASEPEFVDGDAYIPGTASYIECDQCGQRGFEFTNDNDDYEIEWIDL